MNFEEDDEQSSGIAMLKKSFATSFDGANINMVVIGDYMFERVDKLPKDVLYAHREGATAKMEKQNANFIITREKIGRCIKAIQKYFWGSSSYAVVFCVLRDKFGYGSNMKRFEEDMQTLIKELHLDFVCPTNTIACAIYHNKFMKYDIDKWEGCQAKKRSIRLAKYIFDAMKAMS